MESVDLITIIANVIHQSYDIPIRTDGTNKTDATYGERYELIFAGTMTPTVTYTNKLFYEKPINRIVSHLRIKVPYSLRFHHVQKTPANPQMPPRHNYFLSFR